MTQANPGALLAAQAKMRAAAIGEVEIDCFSHYFELLRTGATGVLAEADIEPVIELPALEDLPRDSEREASAAQVTAIIKLNGGLGTSMGLPRAKSLLPIKNGLCFLDVIALQTVALRRRYDARLPLILMNSFSTRADSLALLDKYPQLASEIPGDFLQSREPKLRVCDLMPVEWPADPALEWCPPGHGDLYLSLVRSGMLAALIEQGYRYAFVSNADNLGAVFDPRIVAWMDAEGLPFVAEQCDRTEADRKGGHLARYRDSGRLTLRETAQTAPEDLEAMADIRLHRYFNANSIWLDLNALWELMAARDNLLGLPLIRNTKTVDPSDPTSPAVYQLETAMGSAISAFEGARALRVSRARFVPVKTTDDLLTVRSDVYEINSESEIVIAQKRRGGPPFVSLDPRFYKLLADFDERFPTGPPSLIDCQRLVVVGDVTFGAGVVAGGDVIIEASDDGLRAFVADATVLRSRKARLEGIHHVTAVTGDAVANVEFYVRMLGLRLVKKTVNQDDPTVYHLFYGDDEGSSGHDLTFFEYPGARIGRAGDGMVHTVAFRVADEAALDFWERRLSAVQIAVERSPGRLGFADPEGLRLELVVEAVPDEPLRATATDVPREHALLGFAGVRAYASDPARSRTVLEETLGFTALEPAGHWEVRGAERGAWLAYDEPPVERGVPGAGTIHHVAFATRINEHDDWQERVAASGLHPTPVIDRFYFKSIYFREPSGVLFELATMGPGFTVDEPLDTLGQSVALPPFLESRRGEIERGLTPLPQLPPLA